MATGIDPVASDEAVVAPEKIALFADWPSHPKGTQLTLQGDIYVSDDGQLWLDKSVFLNQKDAPVAEEVIVIKGGETVYRPKLDGTVESLVLGDKDVVDASMFFSEELALKAASVILDLLNSFPRK